MLAYYKKLEENVAENTMEQNNDQSDSSMSKGSFNTLEMSTYAQDRTYAIFRSRRNGERQANVKSPSLNNMVSVGSKLFKSKGTPTILDGSRTNRKPRKRKNDIAFSKGKQARIDVDKYSTEDNKSMDAKIYSNRTNDAYSKIVSDLVIID